MKIAVRGGHDHRFTGASGIVDELTEDRIYSKMVMTYLREQGHEVLDVTPDRCSSVLADLEYGVSRANEWGADLFVSCHVNCAYDSYNGALGCEVLYHPGARTSESYAIKVEAKIAELGFESRGAKSDVRGLYELRHTHMPAIIIEPFFVEATEDVALYRKIGPDRLAEAIAEGICGIDIPSHSGAAVSESVSAPAEHKIGYTTAKNGLNVRNGAGMYDIVRSLPFGTKVEIADERGGWLQIGTNEWIFGKYVQFSQPSSQSDVDNKQALVRDLQRQINLQGFGKIAVDGLVGPATIGHAPMLRSGARGEITKIAQKLLMMKGYGLPKYGADGCLGAEGVAAVERLQKAAGIAADGIVGHDTWRALLG